MTRGEKELLVVVDTEDAARAAEALRAAVGLGLRGDRVHVFFRRAPRDRAPLARAEAILGELGQRTSRGGDGELSRALRRAGAVEVWR